jgi:EAL domain-containing protein (putative c-di-GMP-specific phosphodiesterase class I)
MPIEPTDLATSRERTRLAALESYGILDTAPEAVFDELARLAAAIGGTPAALVSLVDGTRQWFKAKVGLQVSETSRDVAFCAHAIASTQVFVVPDATKDKRFVNNPLVTGDPKIRFYAGAPLITPQGDALGTLCVIDYIPRDFGADQCEALRDLAQLVMTQIELRRRVAQFVKCNSTHQKILADIRRGIVAGEFQLHYQPTVDVRTGHIVSLEALIRWTNLERGPIAPAGFLPILEESGLIVEVGRWIFQRAADDYRDWLARGLTAPTITINVSPRQFRDPGFISLLEVALDPDGASPVPLDIEINESVVLDEPSAMILKLQAVQRLGVHVAIDDFGTGHSSLRHLAHMPIDTLKLDRSFIAKMTESPDDMELVVSIIALAHRLSLGVVAKGVETEEQRKLLRLLRCDHMQGRLINAPAGKDDTEASLRDDQSRAAAEWELLVKDSPYGVPFEVLEAAVLNGR